MIRPSFRRPPKIPRLKVSAQYAKAMKWHWSEADQVYYCGHGECVWYGVCQAQEAGRPPPNCRPASAVGETSS